MIILIVSWSYEESVNCYRFIKEPFHWAAGGSDDIPVPGAAAGVPQRDPEPPGGRVRAAVPHAPGPQPQPARAPAQGDLPPPAASSTHFKQ